jgi:hypothetical protein
MLTLNAMQALHWQTIPLMRQELSTSNAIIEKSEFRQDAAD